ncbi:MAG: HAMP domain-containing protein [Gammaproteobacteria bacterium]|nr:HAMP domain-containing protein [Gammaproteobacteria bacterium]
MTLSLRRLLFSHDLAFLLLVVVTGAIAGAWAFFWQQTSAESLRLNELAHTAEGIRTLVYRQIKEAELARLREDVDAAKTVNAFTHDIGGGFNALRRRSASRAEDYAIQSLQQAYQALQADVRAMFEDPYLLNRIVRLKLLDPRYEEQIVGGFESAYRDLLGLVSQELRSEEAHVARWTRLAPLLVPAPILFAVGLLVLSRARLNSGFVQPMREVMAGVRRMRGGELGHRLPEHGVAELAALAESVNEMAAELAASRDRLVDTERQAALGTLVPVVAHNIRNPLAAIRANAQMLEHAETPQEIAEGAAAIISTVDRLGRWVNALVSYLHPLQPVLRTHRAAALFEDVIALLPPRVADKNLRFERQPWHETAEIEVDADLMEQALYGLLLNAADASPAGATIVLGVEALAGGLRFSIADRAGGMPFLPEPGGLTPGPTTKRFGTGLGIPVAYKVCKAHGWALSFAIEQGVGTTVTAFAPLERRTTDPGANDG